MPIVTLMTTATEASPSSCRRPPSACLAAMVLAIAFTAAPVWAAGGNANKTKAAKEPSAATAAITSETPKHSGGSLLCNGIRLQDEIVVVNTRSICGWDPEVVRANIRIENYEVCDEAGFRRWQKSDLNNFLEFDPTVHTIFFVHGNQIDPGYAKGEGLSVYRKLILQDCNAPRIRFVIISWPSSKVGGLLRDVREKAARTGPAGYHLAWLVDQMPAETPVSMVGFSFGARIITGSLHILAGGSLGGPSTLAEHVHPHRAPVNAVLIAAASHSYWLGEGQYHGLAMTQANRMLFINNCEDRAMVYYDLLVPGHGGPQAMGLCGPTQVSPKHADKIFNRDVSRYVGSQHDLMAYICAPGNAGLIWDYAGPVAESTANASN